MPNEDPIARIDRERAEKKGSKKTVTILGVLTGVLACVLAVVAIKDYKMVKELEQDKTDLEQRIIVLKSDFDNLQSDYDFINSQLDSSREEVNILVDRIKKTEATNRKKMRQYEKELGTLRSIMKSYVVQIDSLNTANRKLAEELSTSRQELAKATGENKALNAKVENLSSKVATGSIVKARGLSAKAYNSSNKVTDRSSRVKRLAVSLSLVENELAKKGPMNVYVRVKDPEGNLLLDGEGASFKLNGEAVAASASRQVDYQGAEVDMIIYVNNVAEYTKGIYTIDVYTDKAQLGSLELLLR
jgi:myosin heavy subunit